MEREAKLADERADWHEREAIREYARARRNVDDGTAKNIREGAQAHERVGASYRVKAQLIRSLAAGLLQQAAA